MTLEEILIEKSNALYSRQLESNTQQGTNRYDHMVVAASSNDRKSVEEAEKKLNPLEKVEFSNIKKKWING